MFLAKTIETKRDVPLRRIRKWLFFQAKHG
jgi:hypothetical protein